MVMSFIASMAVLLGGGGSDGAEHRYFFGDYRLCLEVTMEAGAPTVSGADLSRLFGYRYYPEVQNCLSSANNPAIGSDQLVEPNVFVAIYEQAERAFRSETSIVNETARSGCPESFVAVGDITYIQWPKIGRNSNVEVFASIDCDDETYRLIDGVFVVDFENGNLELTEAWIEVHD